MEGAEGDMDIANYRNFDFESLWEGREKVTAVESFVLGHILGEVKPERLLDAGFGYGRLYSALKRFVGEYFAIDINPDAFDNVLKNGSSQHSTFLVANAYHLPFKDNSFSAAVMLRVHHHLDNPSRAMSELARVVMDRGTVCIWYNPRPSLSTLIHDFRNFLSGLNGGHSLSGSKSPFTKVSDDPFPIFSSTRREFRRQCAESGLRVRREYPMGFEDIAPFSRLPLTALKAYPILFGRIPFSPAILVELEVDKGGENTICSEEEIVCCPKCGETIDAETSGAMKGHQDMEAMCRSCGYIQKTEGGIPDLSYYD